jgi:hypothetical protein
MYAAVESHWLIFCTVSKYSFRNPIGGLKYGESQLGNIWEMGVLDLIVWTKQLHDPSHAEE